MRLIRERHQPTGKEGEEMRGSVTKWMATMIVVAAGISLWDAQIRVPLLSVARAEASAAEGTAGASEPDASDLAKKTQNPVSDLISVPLQNNFNFGVGPGNDVQWILNIQPVAPVRIAENWNLINRPIIPVIYQPEMETGAGSEFGLGDIQYQGYLSPAKPGKVIWGAGVSLGFPSATENGLGTDKWTAGPGIVVLTMPGHWVIGALVNNVWSYAGSGDQDVNQMLIQPIINYNLAKGWYLTSVPIITANWEADSGNRWTIPIGGGAGKIFKVGKQPVNTQLQAFYNLDKPENTGADWQLRFQIQLLFPK
jgi:hypothetical protein